MDPMLLGYFPKRVVRPPEALSARGVEEIASVSLCLAGGPEGWQKAWKHNEWGYFPNPELAWSVVAEGSRSDFSLYAYALYPLEYRDGRAEPLELAPPDVMPPEPALEVIGFDVVSRSASSWFECSPLSCNLRAQEIATNRYCLFAESTDAHELARSADGMGCEPGPYHVVQVWRARR